jgi:IclR family KDG regulon transcriptional repressor
MSESVRAVERALAVLLCFSRNTPELTLTQIAERVELNKSTVHRLLATLDQNRFIQRDSATGAYRPGIRLMQFAYLMLEQNDLRRYAAPFLRRLWEQYRETVDLAVLDNAEVVYLEVLESPQRVKLAAAIGQRLPAFCTATGKALLAFMDDETIQRVIDNGMPKYTDRTILSREALLENLRAIRARRVLKKSPDVFCCAEVRLFTTNGVLTDDNILTEERHQCWDAAIRNAACLKLRSGRIACRKIRSTLGWAQ